MPRTLLLIDEFQEFFVEDDGVSQEAALLLDRIVRQGRAFGIHVILGSQTLGGAYTLARATLGQMVIRIALQCNETDAHLIMDDDNPAPRMLTRPGEGIYNDQAGALAANSPFQVVWLPEDERNAILDQVAARAAGGGPTMPPPPIIFEGNAPADVRDNTALAGVARASGRPSAGGLCLAGSTQFDQGPHRGGLPTPERKPSVSHRPIRRTFGFAVGYRHGFALGAISAGTGGVRRARSPCLRNRGRSHVPSTRGDSTQPDPRGGPAEAPELMAALAAELAAARRHPAATRRKSSCSSTTCNASRLSNPRKISSFRSMTTRPPPPARRRFSRIC